MSFNLEILLPAAAITLSFLVSSLILPLPSALIKAEVLIELKLYILFILLIPCL